MKYNKKEISAKPNAQYFYIVTFIKDKNEKAKVVGEREVEYKGHIWKLSPLVRHLFENRSEVNKSGAYQGAAYFEYNGTKLKDLPDKF